MPVTPSPASTASLCLHARLCDPIAGHSVMAAVPPVAESSSPLPALVVSAAADSRSLWNNAPGGAWSASGAAVLAAAVSLIGPALREVPAERFRKR